jgi:hypothetical protein
MPTPRVYRYGSGTTLGVVLVALLVVLSVPAVVAGAETTIELEPNDTFGQAMPVTGGTLVAGVVDGAGDADGYRVDLEAGEELFVGLPHDGTIGDLDLVITDDTGTVLAVSSTHTEPYEELTGVAPYTGSYYIVVVPYRVSGATPYVLDVLTGADAAAAPAIADREPNDEYDVASSLALGSLSGTTADAQDVDIYAVRLEAGETLGVDLAAAGEGVDVDLFIDGPQGEFLAGSFTESGTESVTLVAPMTGTYFVVVWPRLVTEATPYLLSVDQPAVADVVPAGADEPNGDFAIATLLAAGTYTSSADGPSDLDVYALSLDAGEAAQVDLTSESGDTDIYLYAPDMTLLDWSLEPAGTDSVSVVAPTGGVYYVLVVPFGADEPTPYTLEVMTETE